MERPLRLNFQASPERLARLEDESAFQNLAVSKKKGCLGQVRRRGRRPCAAAGHPGHAVDAARGAVSGPRHFLKALEQAAKQAGLKLSASVQKAILSALSERDETAAVCRDKDGHPEPDPELRDTENVPLAERIEDFFAREVQPHVPDAWINTAIRDEKDGGVGKVGYEINFNRYFYKYQPPRPLEEIEADIKTLEREILEMLRDVAG